MVAVAFDTLKFAKRLAAAGVPLMQAEAEADVLSEIFEINLRQLATKEDLQREIAGLEQRLDAKHKSLSNDLRHEISDLRKDVDTKHESLRHEIGDLRKDMDAKFAGVDARFTGLEERLNSRFDKLLLQLTFRLGGVIVATLTALSLLSKIFH